MSLTDDKPGGPDSADTSLPEAAPPEDAVAGGETPEKSREESTSALGIEGEAQPGSRGSEELAEENRFLLDQLQRARAELENYRRRTIEERRKQQHRVTAELFRQILPLCDDLELAVRADQDGDQLREGLRIIVDKFLRLLEEQHIEPVDAVGHPFDPQVHEAMFHVETKEHAEGEVMEELERGYRLGEALIRPARVKVAKAPADPTQRLAGDR